MTWFGIVVAIGVVGTVLALARRREGKLGSGAGGLPRRMWSAVRGDATDIAEVIAEKGAALARPVLGELGAPEFVYVRTSVPEATLLQRQPVKTRKVVIANLNRHLKAKSERMGLEFAPATALTLQIELGQRAVIVSYVPLTDPFGTRHDGIGAEFDQSWPSAGQDTGSIPTEAFSDGVVGDLQTEPYGDIPTMPARCTSTIDLALHVPGSADSELMVPTSPTAPVLIGRASVCDLRLPEMPGLSNRHLVLQWSPKGLTARDTSTWGTYLRGDDGQWGRLPKDVPVALQTNQALALDREGFVTLDVSVSGTVNA